jgi:hypothetical protein|tara:strand:- start:519 stop:719 length:201 start_codon:yes stop_codon:yes gene_type:complete
MNQFARQSDAILRQGLESMTEKSDLLKQSNQLLNDQVNHLLKEKADLEITIARLREELRAERGEVE